MHQTCTLLRIGQLRQKTRKAVWPDCEALTFDLETWNLQGQGHRLRSQWKQLMKVYLHMMCERVIDHGLGTMKLNANNKFDLETWNLQGKGHRQRSQWV